MPVDQGMTASISTMPRGSCRFGTDGGDKTTGRRSDSSKRGTSPSHYCRHLRPATTCSAPRSDDAAELVTRQVASPVEGEARSLYRSFPSRVIAGGELLAFGMKGNRRDLMTVVPVGVLGAALGTSPLT